MSFSTDLSLPESFRGVTRLFPLPNLILYPQLVQPLHIFEPRYRALMQEALQGDQLITMAILAPGWESAYEGRPALHPTACLGRIAAWNQQDDGRYNLLLAGMRRVRIVEELASEKPFREARVEVLEDEYPIVTAGRRTALRQRLTEILERVVSQVAAAGDDSLDRMLDAQIPLGVLVDILAAALKAPWDVRLALLDDTDADRRAQRLLAHLEDLPPEEWSPPRKFPPDVSSN